MEKGGIKEREKKFFNDKNNLLWLKSLCDDRTRIRRFILNETLKMWDRDLCFMDRSMFEGKKILEGGCGDMRYGSFLKYLGADDVIGCDISIDFIRRGRLEDEAYVCGRKVKKYRIVAKGDCEKMPFGNESFDTVLLFHSLHHMHDKKAVIRESHRILKPGGFLLIADLNKRHVLRGIGDTFGRKAGIMSPDEDAIDPEKTINLLKENGFDIESVRFFNFLSEISFHVFNKVMMLSETLGLFMKCFLPVANIIDNTLERTIFKGSGRFGWRCLVIAKRASGR